MRQYITSIKHFFYSLTTLYRLEKNFFIDSIIIRNNKIIYICAFNCMFLQACNIFRVLFLSSSKLSSLNNRIFFFFYLSLFTVSLLVIALHHCHFLKSAKANYSFQVSCAIFYIYWNLFLNSYSLLRDTSSSTLVYMSALIFVSMLLRFKPLQTLFMQIIPYCIFLVFNYSHLDSNDINNLSIIVFVSSICTLLLFLQELYFVHNQQELIRTNTQLELEEDNLRMGLEKHQIIMEETNLFSFDWHLATNTLVPSRNCADTLGWPSSIVNPMQWFQEQDNIFQTDLAIFLTLMNHASKSNERRSTDLRIRDYHSNYTWYRLQLFTQCNHSGNATTIVGTLLNIDGNKRLIANLHNQLQAQIDGAKHYLDQMKDTQKQTQIYRHDMRHSLLLMEQLAHQGSLEKLCAYLEETHSKLESISPNYYCDNEIINLILSTFDQLAHKQEIRFTTNIIMPSELSIHDTELCALLFNLLDNATSAASNALGKELKYIHVKAVYNHKNLLFFVENGFHGKIVMNDEIPVSTSGDADHGFGIKSIISIVEKYNGLYTFETKNNHFYAKVLLVLDE